MENIKKHLKTHYILYAFGIVGITFAAMNFNNPPLFQNTDNFVLFAQEEIELEKEAQISSGDLGSNKEIDIQKDAIINGNLFADEIEIDKNTQINGNVSFNKLKTHKETKIFGIQTKPVSLPIANLPEIPEFQIGDKDFKFEGEDNTLAAGSYRDLTLEKNSRLTLIGGTYNINRLFLKENSTLIFSTPTTLNIKKELKSQQHIAILPGNNNLKPTDLVINYIGLRLKNEKEEKEDDDEEINAFQDDKEKKDNKDEKIGRPVVFGRNSFLNFKLLAPKASVHIGEDSTIRGQILAMKAKVEKGVILSREEVFSKDTDLAKIVTVQGEKFPVNEIILVLRDDATFLDAQNSANLVKGRIIGFIPTPPIYKIEIPSATPADLDALIVTLRNQQNPIILFVTKNISGGFQ